MCKGCYQPRFAAAGRHPSVQRWNPAANPEVFTFDPIPEVKRPPTVNPRLRARRRTVRVLYPAQVRKYLPVEKKDWAKRMLLLFLSIVMVQVYGATEMNEEVTSVVTMAGAPSLLSPNVSRELTLEISALPEERNASSNGLASLLPNLPAVGDDPRGPATASPREIVVYYRMMYGPAVCRL
ncbi:radiation-inducible immediate-early gene IEX-1-like [Heptranchias perlo]|uniref:radiation-inducible immediate-early gene IEX-1-like n=1 Tax=Heptranchias perlo TaxID=212740 RepID=UPI003559E4C6